MLKTQAKIHQYTLNIKYINIPISSKKLSVDEYNKIVDEIKTRKSNIPIITQAPITTIEKPIITTTPITTTPINPISNEDLSTLRKPYSTKRIRTNQARPFKNQNKKLDEIFDISNTKYDTISRMEFDIENDYRNITIFNYMLQDDGLTQDEPRDILSRINNIKENISKKEKELDKLKKKIR